MRVQSSRFCNRMPAPAFLSLLLLGVTQPACKMLQKVESKSEAASPVQPGMFTLTADQLSHLKTGVVGKATWAVNVHTTGTVDWDADHTTQAITQVNGPITRIVVDTGTPVKQGEPLLYVASPDLAAAVSTYRKAMNREAFNKRGLDRMKELLDQGAVAVKDYESSQADFNDAMTDVQNSLQALRIFGITPQGIDQAEKQGTAIATELAVRSPITGVIVQKLVSPGQVIQAGQTACFMVSDVSTVWVQGHVFDRDLPNVRIGDTVDQTNAGLGRVFRGTVAYIGSFLDPDTRTTPVRIVTQNPGGILKKDMFVEAEIHTGSKGNTVVVPVSAVLRDDKNEPIVYVQLEPGKFAQRQVAIGSQQNGLIAIASGLKVGETVVSDGGLFLQFAGSIQ
jgi:cobalt-zinc-cadmium efflux system membrane fusion protein